MTYGASRAKYVTYTTETDGRWMSRPREIARIDIDLTANSCFNFTRHGNSFFTYSIHDEPPVENEVRCQPRQMSDLYY